MARLSVIGQIVWMNAGVIRCGVASEANCLNLRAIFEESLAHAMHSVHDAAVAGKNDGEGKIADEHQARMIDDFAAGQDLVPSLDQ
jgi:hypothetical protein